MSTDALHAKTASDATALFEELLARAGSRDRISIERHLRVCDAEADPNHGRLWRRLAGTLGSLAKLPVRLIGPQVVLFFVQDGKYRMQVFAIEDQRDGNIVVYLPNVIDLAIRQRVIAKAPTGFNTVDGHQRFDAQTIDAANTNDPPMHVKHLIGWNRKALKVTLSAAESSGPRVDATEKLCALAAKSWAASAASAP